MAAGDVLVDPGKKVCLFGEDFRDHNSRYFPLLLPAFLPTRRGATFFGRFQILRGRLLWLLAYGPVAAGSVPNTMSKGSGFQHLIYQFGPADLAARYKLNMNLGLITCAASIVVTCFLLRLAVQIAKQPGCHTGPAAGQPESVHDFLYRFYHVPF